MDGRFDHIPQHGPMGEQVELLEDHSHAPPHLPPVGLDLSRLGVGAEQNAGRRFAGGNRGVGQRRADGVVGGAPDQGVLELEPEGKLHGDVLENAYGLAMRRDRAEQLGIATIADLAAHAANLSMGGDLEFFSRPEWAALQSAYGLQFARRRDFDPTFMYQAVTDGEVDVISAFTSDGRIAANDLLVLADPAGAILPYDAIVLIARKRANDDLLRRALTPLIDAIPLALMQEANYRVDRERDKETPAAAARWIETQIAAMSGVTSSASKSTRYLNSCGPVFSIFGGTARKRSPPAPWFA